MQVDKIIVDSAYVLHEKLGQGGMAAVYRACCLIDGHWVALKLLRNLHEASTKNEDAPALPDRLRLAREFQTLSSLHHPNVIRVESYGFDRALGPYYTMELLQNAQNILEAAADQPLVYKAQLLAQLLRALIYLHHRGILHRDIKPGNVLIVENQLKVVDFGIAVEASRIEDVAGTLAYMAPELLLGQPPSIASDLYAVGVVAYQMLVGRFPYNYDSVPHLLAGILGERADLTLSTAVLQLVGGYTVEPVENSATASLSQADEPAIKVEGPLGPIVNKLLGRESQQRYSDSIQVLRDLGESLGQQLPIETIQTRESFLQASQFVGRHAELQGLNDALMHAALGHGSCILLAGESGVGKSRLLSELRTLALVNGFWGVDSQSVHQGGAPYQEWLVALRTLCLRVRPEGAEVAMLKPLLPNLSGALAQEVPDRPAIQTEMVQAELFKVVGNLLRREQSPGLLVFEDLQWMRSESVALLRWLSEQVAGLPLLIVGSYRSDERPELPAELPTAQLITLPRLSREEIRSLIVSMLGETTTRAELVDYLCQQTEGNAFFVVEVVRALAERVGELQGIGREGLPAHLLTGGIQRVVERRVDSIPEPDRALLTLAAALGQQLDLRVMSHLFPGVPMNRWLITCANAAVLESSGSHWRFAHDKLRQALLKRLDGGQRGQLHQQVAQAIEAVYEGSGLEEHCETLAYHYQQAGAPDKARVYFMRAGDRAMRLCMYAEARVRYAEAHRMLAELPDSAENRRCKVDILLRQVQTGMLAETTELNLARIAEARALLSGLSGAAECQFPDQRRSGRLDLLLARIHYYRGQQLDALQACKRVLPVAEALNDEELLAFPSQLLGAVLLAKGEAGQCLPLLRRAIALQEKLDNDHDRLRTLGYCAIGLVMSGRYREGMAMHEQVVAHALNSQQPAALALAHTMRSSSLRLCGDFQGLFHEAQLTCELADKSGDQFCAYVGLSLLAWSHSFLGNHPEALKHRSQAQKLTKVIGTRMLGDWFLVSDAEIALYAGEYEKALSIVQKITPPFRQEGRLLALGLAEQVWGAALALRDLVKGGSGVQPDEADAHLAVGLKVMEESEQRMGGAILCLQRAQICCSRSDTRQAAILRAQGIAQFEAAECPHLIAGIEQSHSRLFAENVPQESHCEYP